MRSSVAAAFAPFNSKFEGVLPYMYTDSLGYVTTGMGNLIDPVGMALPLPWQNPDGSAADASTIAAQWQTVKDAYPGVQSVNCGPLTTIRLSQDGIQQGVQNAIALAEAGLRADFPDYDAWPADAQLALLSMAWAMGSGFGKSFPQFSAAVNGSPPNFAAAAPPQALGHFQGSGIAARIAANDLCWQNAAAVVAGGGSYDTLWWPNPAPSSLILKADNLLPPMVGILLLAGAGAAAYAYPDRVSALWRTLKEWV